MKLSALLLTAYLVPATAQTPSPPAVVIPNEDFEAIKQEFGRMRAIIEEQGKVISKLRQRYECS